MTRRELGLLAAAWILASAPARAQISPGPLSRPHAELEGSGQCARCHEAGRGVVGERCLACHRAVQERVRAGNGLHSRPGYDDCKTCHIEHQGEGFELVWWGKAGRESFDHREAGYALEGRHARLACRDCHQPRLNRRGEALAAEGIDLARTYLGLSTGCVDCHADEHHGQFAGQECTSCHGQQSWRPAPGFDHAKTSWPLSGRHATVACARCHREGTGDPGDPSARYVRFKGVAGRECASCHEDVHRARLGTDCARCHATNGWHQVERARFDHGRTRYPLAGRHARVECDRCHPKGSSQPLRHERCTDCHRDAHFGQLVARNDGGACESCHSVEGFSPARFGLAEHQETDYPLTGGHAAVACNDCHVPATVEELRRTPGIRVAAGARGRGPRFRFASTRCAACHRDVHRGELDRWVQQEGCEGCHDGSSWRSAMATFDHRRTRFELLGGHAKSECAACHRKVDEGTSGDRIAFADTPSSCRGCHQDPHQGQFESATRKVGCDGCHAPDTLKASLFDHERGSRWPLDGAHARVGCAECHRRETRDGTTFVRYKPLPTTCRGCHAPSRLSEKEVAAR